MKRRFQLVLIKPSHYHDDGYVIRWWRALIPSNSLASVYGLALDCAKRHVLGEDVEIDIDLIDETNTRVNIPKLIRRFRRHDNFGLLALVGVQSNQYPRALDLARHFRAAGIPMALGGFHVSGCLSMLDGKAIDLELASDLGISIFAGEAEERLEAVLQDAAQGRMKPLYNFMKDLPSIGGTPTPFLPHQFVKRTAGTNTSFDAGRGCPFQCSFCTIINVQGRKSRFRSPDDIEKVVRENWAQGISRFFITDDNFARNKEWEAIYDRLAKLREVDKIPLGLMIQVDTMCHKIPNFVEKSRARGRHAGVHRARERQPGQPDRRQEAAEQDHRISQDAAGLEGAEHLRLCRLYPGLPRRHAGIDPARHLHHQARAPARHARVQHPHPASRLRGPQGAVGEGRRHGCRSQQIRPRARGHRPSDDEPGQSSRRSIRRRGRSTTRQSTSRRCCGARS